VYFNTVTSLVNYLKTVLVPAAFNQTTAQYTQYLAELGHGYDDGTGIVLTRAVAESFEIGVVKDGRHVRTDVHTAAGFTDEGYGD
jgi:predicted TIM-barrel enzyme